MNNFNAFVNRTARRLRHSYCFLPPFKYTKHCDYARHIYADKKEAWHGHEKKTYDKLKAEWHLLQTVLQNDDVYQGGKSRKLKRSRRTLRKVRRHRTK